MVTKGESILSSEQVLADQYSGPGSVVIIVGTIPRSGSTWIFNCVKKILNRKNEDVYSSWIEDYVVGSSSRIHLIKAHDPEPVKNIIERANVCISSRRDLRDVAASLKRMGWAKKDEAFFEQMKWVVNRVHKYWNEKSDLEIDYEEINGNPTLVIGSICKLLGVSVNSIDCSEISAELASLENPFQYDKETLLHPGHRGQRDSHYSHSLNEVELKFVEEYFIEWMSKYGYK